MNPVTRRDFLATATASVALTALSSETLSASPRQEDMMSQAIPSAFAAAHETKPLSFNPTKLDGISEKLIVSHHDNNYAGSVKALNTLKERLVVFLNDDTTPAFLYNDIKREHLLRTGSVILHELYFDNLGGTGQPDRGLSKLLSEAFGSTSTWEKEFKRMGAGLGGGSGWVMLGYNLHSGLLENYWQWDHAHAPSATLPILVMDMYEHSYHMDYGAKAKDYVDAFFRNIHWETVDKRLQRALTIRRFWMKGEKSDGMIHM